MPATVLVLQEDQSRSYLKENARLLMDATNNRIDFIVGYKQRSMYGYGGGIRGQARKFGRRSLLFFACSK